MNRAREATIAYIQIPWEVVQEHSSKTRSQVSVRVGARLFICPASVSSRVNNGTARQQQSIAGMARNGLYTTVSHDFQLILLLMLFGLHPVLYRFLHILQKTNPKRG